jgi:adenine-specific DNA-methyltransferase
MLGQTDHNSRRRRIGENRDMAKTRRTATAATNGKVPLDPVTRAPARPAGPGMYLHWEGRKGYRTRMPAPRMLEPVPKLSFGTPRDNRVIEGDNLQVMVSLRSQYQGSIDVAYLDPPYNTGKRDFAYSDARFHDPNADADDMVYVNNEDGGRHTKWLNYLGPRLWLTWQLLAEHGICFVSINDIELFRLGMLMDEIFGERNRLGVIVWKQAADNNPTRIAVGHEYILCYAKREEEVPRVWAGDSPAQLWLLQTYEKLRKKHRGNVAAVGKAYEKAIKDHATAFAAAGGQEDDGELVDLGDLARYYFVDERGPYAANRTTENPHPGGYVYDVTNPDTGLVHKKPGRGYRFPEETMRRLESEDRIIYPKDPRRLVQLKKYLRELRPPLRGVIELGSRGGAADLKRLLPKDAGRFPNPKPTALIEALVGFAGDSDALVLDPFAGSGTTGHAVMRLNAADGGSRRFILIEEGTRDDRYCRTFVAPRLKAAIQKEDLPGGFSFETTGRRLNRGAILELEREAISNLIVHTDATGKGRGITRVAGEYVVGHNARQEAICLCWNGRTKSAITRDVLVAMFDESKARGLRRPLRVYAATCEVGETDSFRFCQIPDEILAALQIAEDDGALAGDPDAVETLESALLSAADAGG